MHEEILGALKKRLCTSHSIDTVHFRKLVKRVVIKDEKTFMVKMVVVKQLDIEILTVKWDIKTHCSKNMKNMLISSNVIHIYEIIFFKEKCHGQGLPII